MSDWRRRGRDRSAAKGRAQVGLIEAREATDRYGRHGCRCKPGWDYTAASHPLAAQENCSGMSCWRELRLSTYLNGTNVARGPVWSAPNYLLLLSMAVQGFGWCALPCALVEEFAAEKPLVQ
jgi:DNA-binding transcriptional LysR family regulator